ncbi:MAG: hypothetical protein A2505_01970 [Deltaproteobacteria bacterium RIFOXYD12_FULL_55_16]|nr:MAG: hypothetical protein A2505_01970 [Deltaproteobacteria bacterium RIFOXYD12_FULL_55_16]
MHNKKNKIDSLDLLRAAAIVYIVGVLHLNDYIGGCLIFPGADVVTEIFLSIFVFISGYLLTINNPAISNKAEVRLFAKKRFLRLYPLYLFALLLFWTCSFMSVKSLIVHALLLNILIGKSIPTLWFISMICFYYLLFPVIMLGYSLKRTFLISGLAISALLALHTTTGFIDLRLIIYLPSFVFGVIAGRHDFMEKFRHFNTLVFSMLSAFILFSSLYLYFPDSQLHNFYQVLFMLAGIPPAIWSADRLARHLHKKTYKNLAYASFCMYLFHRVIYYILTDIYSSPSQTVMFAYLFFMGVPLIYTVSFIFQKNYDRFSNSIFQVTH